MKFLTHQTQKQKFKHTLQFYKTFKLYIVKRKHGREIENFQTNMKETE